MQLSDYGLSRTRGFLSHYEIDEIALPSQFDAVKQAAEALSDTLTSGRVRHWLDRLADPGIEDWAREAPEEEVRTAMVHYSFLVQAYVWGEPEPPGEPPRAQEIEQHREARACRGIAGVVIACDLKGDHLAEHVVEQAA